VEEILKIEGLTPFTGKSIVDWAMFQSDLDDTRRRGYAVDRGEFREGVHGVSAPVFGPNRQVIATISVVGPEFRMIEKKILDCGAKCMEAAAKLGARMQRPSAV
jgi:DNA-binding IclR family transcriptional regulator